MFVFGLKKSVTTFCLAFGLVVIFPALAAAAPNWYDADWQYRQEITVDNTKVPGDLTGFPILISITLDGLKDYAQNDGDDILITAADGTTKISHEIEKFVGATGELVAWAKAPALSSSADTVFYIYYGNASVGTQEAVEAVWDTDFKLIQHLEETAGTHEDSTSNNNDGTATGGVNQDAAGKIDGADEFDGLDDYIDVGGDASLKFSLSDTFTVSAWVNSALDSSNDVIIGNGWSTAGYHLRVNSANKGRFIRVHDGTNYDFSDTLSALAPGWHHLVGISDGTGVRTYLDGSLDSAQTSAGTVSNITSSLNFFIGNISGEALNFANLIDEVRVSMTDRSADWIATEFNNQDDPAGFFQSPLAAEEQAPNTLAGSNVNIALGGGVEVTFDTVSTDGSTTVITGAGPGGDPSGFSFLGSSFDITTTAGYSGNVVVTVPYDEGLVVGYEADLQLFRWNGSSWQDVTVSVNEGANTITGSYTSLSWWGVGAPVIVPATGLNTSLLGVLSLVLVGSGGAILKRRLALKH